MSTSSDPRARSASAVEENSPASGSGFAGLWGSFRGDRSAKTDREPPSTPDDQGQQSDVQSGFVSLGSVLVISGMLLSLLFPQIPWTVRLLAVAVIFLSLRHWGGILVLVAVQLDLLAREGRSLTPLVGPVGLLYAFWVAAVLMLTARQRDSLQEISRKDIRKLLGSWIAGDSGRKAVAKSEASGDPVDGLLRLLASALRGLMLLLVCATIARYVLDRLPRGRAFSLRLRDFIVDNPELTGVSLLLVGIIATVLVLTEIGWRQMTASQGRVYLRSALLKQMYRDLRMITVQRISVRQKKHGRTAGETDTKGKV